MTQVDAIRALRAAMSALTVETGESAVGDALGWAGLANDDDDDARRGQLSPKPPATPAPAAYGGSLSQYSHGQSQHGHGQSQHGHGQSQHGHGQSQHSWFGAHETDMAGDASATRGLYSLEEQDEDSDSSCSSSRSYSSSYSNDLDGDTVTLSDGGEHGADSDHFVDALSPRPAEAAAFRFGHQQPSPVTLVKCAPVPLVHPSRRDSALKGRRVVGSEAVLTRLGAGDVAAGSADADLDSDDEAIPEDGPGGPRGAAVWRSRSSHGPIGGSAPLAASWSAGDLQQRVAGEAVSTLRSPRTLVDREGLRGLMTDADGKPISVRRVRTALLRLKDIIRPSQDDDGSAATASTAATAPPPSAGPAGRRKDYEEWLAGKRRADEARRQAQRRRRAESERRQREEEERQLQKEIDQERNFLEWKRRKAVLWQQAKVDEEERQRKEEDEREEVERLKEEKKERANLTYSRWMEEKKKILKENLAKAEEARRQREEKMEERRRLADEAYNQWLNRQKETTHDKESAFSNPAPWVDIVPPADTDADMAATLRRAASRRRRSKARCRRCRACRAQRLLQCAERLSRPAAAAATAATALRAERHPAGPAAPPLCPAHESARQARNQARLQASRLRPHSASAATSPGGSGDPGAEAAPRMARPAGSAPLGRGRRRPTNTAAIFAKTDNATPKHEVVEPCRCRHRSQHSQRGDRGSLLGPAPA